MSDQTNRRVIVIDDNVAIHEDFRKILGQRKRNDSLDATAALLFSDPVPPVARASPEFDLDFASQGEEGCDKVRAAVESGKRFAMAFVDMRMPPGWDGLQTIENLWKVDADLQVVICSAYSDYSWSDIVKRVGVVDRLLILKKPFDTAEVCQLACALTEKWQLARYANLKLGQLQNMVEEQTASLKNEIQERRRSETALKTSEDRYALAAAASNDGLWDWDLLGGTIFYSDRWKSMLGHEPAEIGNAPGEWLDRVHPDDLVQLKQELELHIAGTSPSFKTEYRAKGRDGEYQWMLCRGLAVRDSSGKAVRIAGSQADITNRRLAEEQLRHDATHDVLTGLSNRAMLTEQLHRCINRAKRTDGLFAVLFMDLDRFKVVNDSLGHGVGDALLIGIANRLGTCVRDTDTLSRMEPGHLVRLGGDEFVMLLESIREPADAIRVAQRVQQAFVEPFNLQGHEVFTSASIGIAVGDGSYQSPDDVLRDADTALYQSKAAGRGCFHIFESKMHIAAMSRLKIETDLRRAIERNEFVLHYQPILSLETGEVREVEALVRWQHPERGLIAPGEFIAIAEETGVIVELGNWVLREACGQLRRWETEFPWMDSVSIAVNVSGKQFSEPGLVERVESAITAAGLQHDRVHLEITEGSAIGGGSNTMNILRRLSELKVKLHLDDFGTGYSSLSYLHRMPVSALKVDRSFVGNMSSDVFSRSIVETIVTLARTLKLAVIAEGAETIEQVEQLRSAGCDLAQGFYFARPMPAEQIGDFVASKRSKPLALSA
jgi:diguanylate cyclase (GGDEF)-like protein/PAS domain S-box-containing protein